ncbi:hypothetical protein E8F11_22090 [Pseudomonas sp. BN417]|uniref:hypothetical protein n=1 Tax=Pseudomonas sp. BN417 TaxID=2567890 RepID=UPI0024590E9B|nr:hypothetical protein [Pseudomonas sp. BN417]MDH4557827.1 hypothetical protein [Pseudomonas sp. BN417]
MDMRKFLRTKVLGLSARLSRLARIDNAFVGLRAQDLPYAPSPAHVQVANQRLAAIEANIKRRYRYLANTWEQAPANRVLIDIALVERELDRARRAFGMFFEVFAQRGTSFGPALAAHDAIAADCYDAIRQHAPRIFDGPLLKPVCYMEHGYSPATMRRGVQLSRLLGEANPFPLIRIPWDRDQPWQAVFMHEVAHNLQADLGIWQENRQAVIRRLLGQLRDPAITSVYARWHKEIFADLAAILLGGPAAAWGMAEFLAHPAPRVLTYRPGAHPTGYLRIMILAEMLRRLGFQRDASQLTQLWNTFYDPKRFHRLPPRLLGSAARTIPLVVDEIAFQTRRNLAQRALVDILPFGHADQARITEGAQLLMQGQVSRLTLPPRHVVSAAAYALASGRITPRVLADQVTAYLNGEPVPRTEKSRPRVAARREPLSVA